MVSILPSPVSASRRAARVVTPSLGKYSVQRALTVPCERCRLRTDLLVGVAAGGKLGDLDSWAVRRTVSPASLGVGSDLSARGVALYGWPRDVRPVHQMSRGGLKRCARFEIRFRQSQSTAIRELDASLVERPAVTRAYCERSFEVLSCFVVAVRRLSPLSRA